MYYCKDKKIIPQFFKFLHEKHPIDPLMIGAGSSIQRIRHQISTTSTTSSGKMESTGGQNPANGAAVEEGKAHLERQKMSKTNSEILKLNFRHSSLSAGGERAQQPPDSFGSLHFRMDYDFTTNRVALLIFSERLFNIFVNV